MSYKDKCRVCLMDGAKYKIIEDYKRKHSVNSKFFECFKVKIKNVKGYPEKICESCKITLDTVYEFVTKYKTSCKILECGLTFIKKEVDNEKSIETLEKEDNELDILKNEPLSDSDGLENSGETFEKEDYELETLKNEPLSDSDALETLNFWAMVEPQIQKPDISFSEIKAKLKNLKEINIKKKPVIAKKLGSKTRRAPVSVLGGRNGERSQKHKEIAKKLVQDTKLSLPVQDKEKLCDLCGEVFTNVAEHKKSKHCYVQITKCTLCPRVLSGKRGLKRHMDAVHNDKRFICKTCGKCFGIKSFLKGHIEGVHLKIKKKIIYACDKCDKTYTSKNGLVIHDRNVHTGLRPAVCEGCGKSFVHESYLREHQRLHTGETPYKCPVCGRGYAQKGNMRSHMKHNHLLADISPEWLKTKPSWLKYLKRP